MAGAVVALVLGMLIWRLLREVAPTPPSSIAHDPVLVRGFEIYTMRCGHCHGTDARGPGDPATKPPGASPRNLVADDWKHGDTAEAALWSVSEGYPSTGMPAYKGLYGHNDLKAVTAYTLHLAERAVPQSLRVP